MLFEECSFRRSNTERELVLNFRFTLTYRRLLFYLFFILFIVFFWFNCTLTFSNSLFERKQTSNHMPITKSSLPTIARTLYLFLCENQAEIDTYSQLFPSISSDAMFFCWRENCNSSTFRPTMHLYVNTWSSKTKRNEKLVSFESIPSFHSVQSHVFIINEKQLNLTSKLTWTTARNKLYEVALNEERKQGWAWSYYTFVDGDVHAACPLADQLLGNQPLEFGKNEEYLLATHFYSFMNLTKISVEEQKCFLLFDAFLLSISPAIATATGASGVIAFPGLLVQAVYHIDAMFNAIQHDALTFLLPYCPRYDGRTWWTSQAIFVYRSLCLYGHSLSFDGVRIVQQNHREYPRNGNPWEIDNDMNLVPPYLLPLQNYMQQNTFISPIALHHYSGWNLELTSETCRRNHTAIKLDTCLVYGLPPN